METAGTTISPTDEAEVEAVLARLSEQMREAREQMQVADAEIARLKAESAELRAETRAILARLQGQSLYSSAGFHQPISSSGE
jgi:uncharacterized coiled-coil DUF342 family protein